MALVVKDRVKETTTTTGTGTLTLAGASTGYQSFAAVGNGNTCYYAIVGGTEWEVGIGTYTSAGTTLARTTVLASSNGGTVVTLSAGTKDVFLTYPADKAVMIDATQTLTNKTLTAPVISTISNTGTLTLPTSTDTLVGRATTDTLTNKTLTDPAINGAIKDAVFTITDGAAFEIDPGNGAVQLITLGASRTPKGTNFTAGEAVTLMVDDGTAYTLTWTDATWGGTGVVWKTGAGAAPTLNTTGYTVIILWKVSTQVYGARVGNN